MNRIPLLKIQIKQEPDVVAARQKTRFLSELLGFDAQDQARLATAISELARNIYQYARAGRLEFSFALDSNPQAFYIEAVDSGPGIQNLNSVLNGTYVSKTGMGLGILGSKKLMDSFEIQSDLGRGTRILLSKNLGRRQENLTLAKLNSVVDKLILKTPETPFEEIQRQNRDLFTALEELRVRKNELSDLNSELAETNRGVVALYAELDEKASSLQRANEVKTNFLSHMTHEFRTPLSSIISLTRILLDQMDGPLTAEQTYQVSLIRKSSEGLLELVNDLLDLAKVEAGKVALSLTSFSVDEILSGLRGMFRPILGNSSQVELTMNFDPGLPEIHSDQAKITQILRNLVSNAVKYTDRGQILVSAHLKSESFIEFSVCDTGIGIDPEHLESVFEDFSQIESAHQKKSKGTGLGLPISRKLARILGGDLVAESVKNRGSTFRALIPLRYKGPEEAVLINSNRSELVSTPLHPAETVSAQDAFSVLLVDDDAASRYVLRSFLHSEIKANFREAADGKQGLLMLRQAIPDIVFLDLNMDEVSGFDFLKAVKEDPHLKGLPVVINTARKLTSAEELFLSEYATAILSKERPDPEVAIREIRGALNKAGFDYTPRGRDVHASN